MEDGKRTHSWANSCQKVHYALDKKPQGHRASSHPPAFSLLRIARAHSSFQWPFIVDAPWTVVKQPFKKSRFTSRPFGPLLEMRDRWNEWRMGLFLRMMEVEARIVASYRDLPLEKAPWASFPLN